MNTLRNVEHRPLIADEEIVKDNRANSGDQMGERFNENFYYEGGRWWDFYRKWKGCSASCLNHPFQTIY